MPSALVVFFDAAATAFVVVVVAVVIVVVIAVVDLVVYRGSCNATEIARKNRTDLIRLLALFKIAGESVMKARFQRRFVE